MNIEGNLPKFSGLHDRCIIVHVSSRLGLTDAPYREDGALVSAPGAEAIIPNHLILPKILDHLISTGSRGRVLPYGWSPPSHVPNYGPSVHSHRLYLPCQLVSEALGRTGYSSFQQPPSLSVTQESQG